MNSSWETERGDNHCNSFNEIIRKYLHSAEKMEVLQWRISKQLSIYRSRLDQHRKNSHPGNYLAAMSKLTGHISHQLRNPLGSLELFASILKKKVEGDHDLENLVENILVSSSLINQHIENMVRLTRPLNPQFTLIDLDKTIDEILHYSRHLLFQKQILIQREYSKHGTQVHGDRELLKQLFLNLMLNSLQAINDENGKISISIFPGLSMRDQGLKGIMIEIRDTGMGIPAEYLDRVWEPFFSRERRGKGFGLAVAFRIVEAHDGEIEMESREEKGTTVRVFLPNAGSARRKNEYRQYGLNNG